MVSLFYFMTIKIDSSNRSSSFDLQLRLGSYIFACLVRARQRDLGLLVDSSGDDEEDSSGSSSSSEDRYVFSIGSNQVIYHLLIITSMV